LFRSSSNVTSTPPPFYTTAGTSSLPLNTNLAAGAPTSGLFLGHRSPNFAVDFFITAAEAKGVGKLLSKPKITTQNNEKATVKQGTKIPIQTTINNTISVQFIDAVLNLEVIAQGRGETSGVRIHEQKGALFESVGQFLSVSQSSRVGFDPSQVTVGQLQSLQKEAGTEVRWIPAVGKVESLRMRKDRGELAQMRRTAILAGEVVELTIGLLKPGIREFEVGAEIEYQMRK